MVPMPSVFCQAGVGRPTHKKRAEEPHLDMGDYRIIYLINYMGLYGIVWDCMGLYGIVWDCMGLYGIVWDCMGLYGIVWDCMGLYGIYALVNGIND